MKTYTFQYFKKLARKPSLLDNHEAFVVKFYFGLNEKIFNSPYHEDILELKNLTPKYLCYDNGWNGKSLHCCIDCDNPILWIRYFLDNEDHSFLVGFELHDAVESLCTRKNRSEKEVWQEREIFKIFSDYMALRCKRNGYKLNKRELTLKRVSFCNPICDMSEDIQLLNIYTYYLKRKKKWHQ